MQARRTGLFLCVIAALLSCSACAYKDHSPVPQVAPAASTAAPASAEIDRSHVLKLKGILKDHDGKRLTGVVGVLFAIYEQQEDGAPVWQEVQNVELNERGSFTALVGSTNEEGIRPELFGPGKTLWIGMQVLQTGELEQPRVRLVSGLDGLRAIRIVIPDVSEQTAKAEAGAESGGTRPTQPDQSDQPSRHRRASRRFQRPPVP